jgi:hypothetical protein
MAKTHWDAFMGLPNLLMKDWPSVIFHGALSGFNDSLDTWIGRTFPNNTIAQYAADGLVYTLRQDYAFGLIGQEGALPAAAGAFGTSVAY